MSDLIIELKGHIFCMTLNRVEKHNAFDDKLILSMQKALDEAIQNPDVRVILLKSNGKHFSAGADLAWMQRMASFTEAENLADAKQLARLLYTFSESPKPTIAMIQGAAFGGGAGLAAACDIAIAAENARFCFSEVKLGLIPAVISPYVIRAIGERSARWLFMSAETIDASRALQLNLIQQCISEENLLKHTLAYAQQLTELPQKALQDCKSLVSLIAPCAIDDVLQHKTASLIAKKRASVEGQAGLQAFLNKHQRNT